MKTRDHIRALAAKMNLVLPTERLLEEIDKINRHFEVKRLTHVTDDKVQDAYDRLSKVAEKLCPHVLVPNRLELAEQEIAFLRSRWRQRLDEDAPQFSPETTS